MLRRRKKLFGGARFNPLVYSPALWLDASDASTLVMDGARTFASASDQYLSRSGANSTTLTTGDIDWWLSAWHYNTAASSNVYRGIFGKKTTGTANIDFDLCSNRYFGSFLSVGDGTNRETVSISQIPVNTWGHYFCTKINNVLTISVRYGGNLYSDSLTLTYTPTAGTGNLVIGERGAFGATSYSDGYIDSVAFGKPTAGWLASNATALRDYLYNGGSGRRSSDFLASAYYTGGNPSGAVSWWDMDARSGNETDRIGSNNLTDNGGVGYAAGVASGLVQYTGDPVKQWSDKSGNARHFTAPSDAARFTFNTAFQNGLSALSSDGVDDILVNTNQLAPLFNGANKEITVFLVGKKPNLTGGHALWLVANETAGSAGNNDLIAAAIAGTTGYSSLQVRLYSGGTTDKTCAGSVAYTGNTNFILSAVRTSTTGSVYLNGTSQQSGVDLTQTLAGLYYASIGGRIGGTTPTTDALVASNWYEVIVLPTALDSAGITAFNRYLGNKWGITVA